MKDRKFTILTGPGNAMLLPLGINLEGDIVGDYGTNGFLLSK
jgi:hypothetical protein